MFLAKYNFMDEFLGHLGQIVSDVFNLIFVTLCQLIYPLISLMFKIFTDITDLQWLEETKITTITNKIMLVLGIVMTFYIVFEFIKYTVTPDTIADKEKGAMPLVGRIVIAILMLAMVPKIFPLALDFQHRVISSNVIGRIITFTEVPEEPGLAGVGRDFAGRLYGSFLWSTCEPQIDGAETCNEVEEEITEEINWIKKSNVYMQTLGTQFDQHKKFAGLLATIFGGLVFFVVFLYCKDVAVRYIQIVFLQVISPIAIISYISPKKDGLFQKWLKQCTTTYIDVFLRIALLYFMFFLCEQIGLMLNIGNVHKVGGDSVEIWVYLFLVIGLMIFLKRIPKIFQELFPSSGSAAAIGMGFSNKGREGIFGTGRQMAARAAGAIAGIARTGKTMGKKGTGSLFDKNKKGFKNGLKRFATNANVMARAGYQGFAAGKDGKIQDAIRAGQEKVQSYESIVAAGGTVLGHDYRAGHYQDAQVGIQVKLDMLKQMSDAKSSVSSAIGEIKFRKQMDSIGASLQASGNDVAKVAWDKEIKNYEKLARRYASGELSATEYTKLVEKMVTDFDTKHGTTIKDNFKDSSGNIDVSGSLDTSNRAVYETVATRMQEATAIAKEISNPEHKITYTEVERDASGKVIIDAATGEPKRKTIQMPRMNDSGQILDPSDPMGIRTEMINDYNPTTGRIEARPKTFADYIGDFTDMATAAKVQMEASEETKKIMKNAEGKK